MRAGCRDEESLIRVDMAHGEVGKSEFSRVGLLLCIATHSDKVMLDCCSIDQRISTKLVSLESLALLSPRCLCEPVA
jgi:hypothetical protein